MSSLFKDPLVAMEEIMSRLFKDPMVTVTTPNYTVKMAEKYQIATNEFFFEKQLTKFSCTS